MMKRISLGLILAAVLSLLYSFTLPVYINEAEYQQQYGRLALTWQELGSYKASEQFYALRDKYLSHKYRLQDYGLTFLIIGIALWLVLRNGKPLTAPAETGQIVLLGLVAALLTTGGYVGDLLLEFHRETYPLWADSLGIPLMAIPFLAMIVLTWATFNMLTLCNNFKAGAVISFRNLKGSNYFYLALMAITTLLIAVGVIEGYFWMVLPGLLWLYFYASLWAGRYEAKTKL